MKRNRYLAKSSMVTATEKFDVSNRRQWIAHCHSADHAERGMFGLFLFSHVRYEAGENTRSPALRLDAVMAPLRHGVYL